MPGRKKMGRAAARRAAQGTVVEDIKQFIVDEGLLPGDQMPSEVVLCEELGVSRPHLREGLRTLQSLDIVTIRHGRGMQVGSLSLSPMVEALLFRARIAVDDPLRPVREVVDVRERLDLSAAADLTSALAGSKQHELRALVGTMQERHAAGQDFPDADREFHAVLLRTLDNQVFSQVNSAFWQIHTEALPLLRLPAAQDLKETVDAHLAIVEAVEVGDINAYRAAVRAHYAPLHRQLADSAGEDR